MIRPNSKIREYAARSGVYLWQVAQELGYNDSAFSRKLRKELPPEMQEKALAAIERLAEQGGFYGADH